VRRPPPLKPDELEDWAAHGVREADAHRWYETLWDLCGPPSAKSWGLGAGESPSRCALSYALYWLTTFGASTYDEVEGWLPYFPTPYHGAELAIEWREAGWGGTPDRSTEAAGHLQYLGATPDEAEAWLLAGIDVRRARAFMAAGVTLAEAQANSWSDEQLEVLADLRRRGVE